jgi:thiamine biosynthesis lipoprotein
MSMLQHELAFDAIGTHWNITFAKRLSPAKQKTIAHIIAKRIEHFDRTYSRFRSDSLISKAAKAPGRYTFPEDGEKLFAFYRQLYEATNGKVTPLIGNVLVESGYDADYSLTPNSEVHQAESWDDIFSYEHPVLNMKRPAVIDLGAAGKGYLVDIIGELLNSEGINDFLIDAGGDMLHQSPDAHMTRIGLEHPNDPSLVIGSVELGNESICGSATNRRAWRGLHHIMDPDSTEPVRDIIAVWVVADWAMLADGLSTALFFTPANALKEKYQFEYLVLKSDMTFLKSSGFKAEIYS